MPLSAWLVRPGRAVDVRESWQLFCELLLLQERRQLQLGGAGARSSAQQRAFPVILV